MWVRSKPSDSSAAGSPMHACTTRVGRAGDLRLGLARAGAGVVVGVADAVAGGERDLAVAGAQLVEQHVEPGRVDLGGAGALVAGGTGELADHREAWRRRRSGRTPSLLSSTTDSAAASRASAWCASASNVSSSSRTVHALGDQLEDLADPGVEHLVRHLAGCDRGDDLLAGSRPSAGGISRSVPASSAGTRW